MGPLSFLYYLTPFRHPENNPCSLWIIVFSKSMLNFSCPWTWSQSLCKEHSCLFYDILFFRREHNCKWNHRKMWALVGKFLVYFWTSLTKSMRKALLYVFILTVISNLTYSRVFFFVSHMGVYFFFFGTNFSNNLKNQEKVTEQVWILEGNLLFLIAIAHWIKIL